LLLLPLNVYFVFNAEPMRMMWLTNAAPFANVIFFLFLVVGANALLRRFAPRLALGSADLITVYITLSLQTGLGSMNFLHWLMGSVSYGHWAASPQNDWEQRYLRHLPGWLVVTDPEALKGYYLGHSTFFAPRHMGAWLLPICYWTLVLYALLAVVTATATLVSRQWIRRERLSFPVVELPFQMVAEGTTFWRQRRMWLGFFLAAGLELLSAHELFGQGYFKKEIARMLDLDIHTVRTYLLAKTFPERQRHSPVNGPLTPYKEYLLQHWEEGCQNALQLWREVREQGYSGSATTVRDFVVPLRQPAMTPARKRAERAVPSPRALCWLLARPDQRTPEQSAMVEKLCAACPSLAQSVWTMWATSPPWLQCA
jgi:hypothetical protein